MPIELVGAISESRPERYKVERTFGWQGTYQRRVLIPFLIENASLLYHNLPDWVSVLRFILKSR